MPLPVVLFLFLAHSVPSLVVRAVRVQTAAWITENRDCVEEQQQGEQLASPAPGQKSSRGEEEGENQRVAEKCSASARTHHGWDTGKCLSKAAEMCPSTPELVQEGDLCISWALGFSTCQHKAAPASQAQQDWCILHLPNRTMQAAEASVINPLLWARAGSTAFTRLS